MRGGLGRDRALTATIPHHGSCKNLIPCVGGRGPQYWLSGFASCCDQLEAVLKRPDVGPINLSNGLVGLLGAVPNSLIVLGCLEDAWKVLITNKMHESFLARTHKPLKLDPLAEGQAVELVRRRVAAWPRFESGPMKAHGFMTTFTFFARMYLVTMSGKTCVSNCWQIGH